MKSIQIEEIQFVEQNTAFSNYIFDGTQNNHWTLKTVKKKVAAYTIPIAYYLYIQQTSAVPTTTLTFLASVLFQCRKIDSW